MKIEYPISDEVKRNIREYPEIGKRLNIPADDEKSQLEIVGLLGNTHYDHIRAVKAYLR